MREILVSSSAGVAAPALGLTLMCPSIAGHTIEADISIISSCSLPVKQQERAHEERQSFRLPKQHRLYR